MTTAQFKHLHPELAHLEGNDLWNAMEDMTLSNATLLPHQTLEEVQEDERLHPENWVIQTVDTGSETFTFHWPKNILEKLQKDFAPLEDGEMPKMEIMMPGNSKAFDAPDRSDFINFIMPTKNDDE